MGIEPTYQLLAGTLDLKTGTHAILNEITVFLFASGEKASSIVRI